MIKWRVRYKDGSALDQGKNKYEDIDREKLSAFEILDDEKLLFRMFLEEGQRLIYRRRVQKEISQTTNKVIRENVVYMVGWQQKINGKNTQSINYVFPDGHVEQAGKWVGGVPKLRPEEVV